MKTTFTKNEILSNRGCYSKEQTLKLSFIEKEVIDITDVCKSEISLNDKYWFLTQTCELTPQEKVRAAVSCAKIVLPVFESKNLEDKRPRAAINLVNRWLRSPESVNTSELRNAYASASASASAASADIFKTKLEKNLIKLIKEFSK